MRKLSREQLATRNQIAQSLDNTAGEIRSIIAKTNAALEAAREQIDALTNRFNELVQEANDFIEGVHDAQQSYANDRSEAWKESDAGQNYDSWMDEWSAHFDELEEMDFPDEIEEPDFIHPDDLRDLPEAP